MKVFFQYPIRVTLFLLRIGLILFLIVVGWTVYRLLFSKLVHDKNIITSSIALWVLTAYIVLPRLHRLLTKLYVPNYFVGRVRTGEGLLGDPVNLAVVGSIADLKTAMKKAGWIEADYLNLKTGARIVRSIILRQSYPSAPVSHMYLFGLKQDLAFQKQVGNNPRARHHVRFWRTPNGWYLPGGHAADFVGAATYDRSIGFSLFTLQIIHKIDSEVDDERNFVASDLMAADSTIKLQTVPHFMTAYHHRNGGGDSIRTDGSLYFLHI